MKVSIITVSYNAVKTIEHTIQSVLDQDYPDIEYVIVDGGSKDGTVEIIQQKEGQVARWVSEPDKGIYDAMNKGVSLATGDLIGILNADDFYMDHQVISKVVATIQAANADSLYADLQYVAQDNISKVIRTWRSGQYAKGLFLEGWMPPHPTFFLKKSCYEKFGTYNLELRSAADYELMLRMLHKEDISVAYLPEIITQMRAGGTSNASMKNRIKANREDRKAWEMNGLKPKWYTLIKKPLSKLGQFAKRN
ncbi:glycosyltransferase [bacterium SCSIO 12741]|nr:glycosyltransferase [bacterium SCSIO 12741]